MKSDLDRLMAERNLAAAVVAIDHNYSPALDYLAGSIHLTRGLAIKARDKDPILFVSHMETEEAAASGLTIYSYNDMGWQDILKEQRGDRTEAEIIFWGRCLEQSGITAGRIGIYGVGELNYILELNRLFGSAYPQYDFVGETGATLFDEAAITKDAQEIARIKSVAERTSAVLQSTWDYIAGHSAEGETVVKLDGAPLTIGDVKRFVRRQLLDRSLEDAGMIFAQGRDAGFPHSRGQENMPLKLGQSIVFDLFPYELGGGYHHDTTRTWCIGYAPETVQAAYDTVMEAIDVAVEAYGLGKPTKSMEEAVQDYFEQKGHPTLRSEPNTSTGYSHNLGHGIGLKIHERPRITHLSEKDTFQIGNVFTIEPGLYYPDEGYGVRVEDSYYITEAGSLVSLTNFHKELVLPLNSDDK